MLDAILSLLTGGGFGIIGAFLTSITNLWQENAKRKHDLEMKRLDITMMDKEWQYRENAAVLEGNVRLTESADDLLAASYAHDSATYSKGLKITKWWNKSLLILVDVLRGVIRPALTVILVVYVYIILQQCIAILDSIGFERFDPSTAMIIYRDVINRILGAASTCTFWWFGTRPSAARRKAA